MNTTPKHLLPESCYICGGSQHPDGSHNFWSNADALAEARAHDARTTFVYSDGTDTVEGHYVAEYRNA